MAGWLAWESLEGDRSAGSHVEAVLGCLYVRLSVAGVASWSHWSICSRAVSFCMITRVRAERRLSRCYLVSGWKVRGLVCITILFGNGIVLLPRNAPMSLPVRDLAYQKKAECLIFNAFLPWAAFFACWIAHLGHTCGCSCLPGAVRNYRPRVAIYSGMWVKEYHLTGTAHKAVTISRTIVTIT